MNKKNSSSRKAPRADSERRALANKRWKGCCGTWIKKTAAAGKRPERILKEELWPTSAGRGAAELIIGGTHAIL